MRNAEFAGPGGQAPASVAGLGVSAGDVVINGAIDSFNQCFPADSTGNCAALVNFRRPLSDLTINFPAPPRAPCSRTAEFWATSQARLTPGNPAREHAGKVWIVDQWSADATPGSP